MTSPFDGLHELLKGRLDYAGLFPPAKLPLHEAIRNYSDYLHQPERWLLGRFVIQADRLAALSELAPSFPERELLTIAALGRSGQHRASFMDGLAGDLRDIENFRERHRQEVKVDVYETRLPGEELEFQIRADTLIHESAQTLFENGLSGYFEVPFDSRWETRAQRVIGSLETVPDTWEAGFKLRTGGLAPEHFPTPEQVAWIILETGKARVRLKCTAGLHHPFRHFSDEVGAKMHGFVNVFTAGILAALHPVPLATLAGLIADEDPANFQIDAQSISWRDLAAPLQEIREARLNGIVSFGSCSFSEPIEDLRAHRLLPS